MTGTAPTTPVTVASTTSCHNKTPEASVAAALAAVQTPAAEGSSPSSLCQTSPTAFALTPPASAAFASSPGEMPPPAHPLCPTAAPSPPATTPPATAAQQATTASSVAAEVQRLADSSGAPVLRPPLCASVCAAPTATQASPETPGFPPVDALDAAALYAGEAAEEQQQQPHALRYVHPLPSDQLVAGSCPPRSGVMHTGGAVLHERVADRGSNCSLPTAAAAVGTAVPTAPTPKPPLQGCPLQGA
ncbi:hypothetical protein cyc_05487 [Cyclospora cayetanensis]|nr:hypothetical protein cyc_05487 [Cyclospora cayetanensis]